MSRLGKAWLLLALLAAPLLGLAQGGLVAAAQGSKITAVGAENQYANVIAQIGGKYVRARAIMSNPNTDPHTFEASPSVARLVAAAQLVVQNGVGYDTFMNNIEAAAPRSGRQVIDVQHLLKLPDDTKNPHLWYKPATMPSVAAAISAALIRLKPAHRGYFKARLKAFDHALQPWKAALAAFKRSHPRAAVATTEPVADYMLQAAGTRNLTPWALQADIMNGVDPSAQAISRERSLLTQKKVKVFVYNQQVTDSLTRSFLSLARAHGIPVVGVYETMPAPGYDYQSWMLAEVRALTEAVVRHRSTTHL